MYDLSSKFITFYNDHVVLSADKQAELRKFKKLNVNRLKDGLKEYNSENNTSYKFCEDRVQGSVSMHTVVQNDENDYDIDVAIVFEKDNLGDLGPLATRNMVADALKRKTKQFKTEPEVKTSCVRVKYSEGYHIDFAIYRRYKENPWDKEYKYEHAGAEWSERGIRAIEDWFRNELQDKGNALRQIIRLSKMFCRSRDAWVNMPSGLLQTVLCDEKFSAYDRLDERFYYTMQGIVSRLEFSTQVNAPVDNGRDLTPRQIDVTRMINWKNRLSDKLDDLSVLFEETCTYQQAVEAWSKFFNHSYWNDLAVNESFSLSSIIKSGSASTTEQFIEYLYPVDEQYDVTIDCEVIGNGLTLMPIAEYIRDYGWRFGGFIPHNFKVKCKIAYTTAPSYDKVLWKVRNVGLEAVRRNQIRGQITDRGSSIEENTLFKGNHYIECYLIKNGVCIAIGHVQVPIGDS